MQAIELKARREALGLSQAELADTLGVRQATVSRWETESNPIPEGIDAELADLAGTRDALVRRMVTLGEQSDRAIFTVYQDDESFWAAHPEMEGVPAAVQRVAAALAQAELVRLWPSEPTPRIVAAPRE